jgi:hypothetical protein
MTGADQGRSLVEEIDELLESYDLTTRRFWRCLWQIPDTGLAVHLAECSGDLRPRPLRLVLSLTFADFNHDSDYAPGAEPIKKLIDITNPINQLFAKIASGRRGVCAIRKDADKDTYEEVPISAAFWRIEPWAIYRRPSMVVIRGTEWRRYEPQLVNVAQAEMERLLQEAEEEAGHRLKRDHAVEIIQSKTGVARAQARDAWARHNGSTIGPNRK